MMVNYKYIWMYSIFALTICLLSGIATQSISQTGPEIEPFEHFGGYLAHFDIKDDYAYLCQGTVLTVLDISGSEFVEVAWKILPDEPSDIFITGNYAYLYIGSADSALRIVDISNPLQPLLVGSLALEGAWRGKIHVCENYAYLAMGESLKVINVSEPVSPAVVQTIDVPANDVFVAENVVYVGGRGGLKIFDATLPDNLNEVGSFAAEEVKGIFVADNLAYLAGSGNDVPKAGMMLVDVSDLTKPTQLGHFSTTTDNRSYIPNIVEVTGNYAYIAANERLFIADVSAPANPVETNIIKITRGAYPGIESLRVDPPYLYFATGESSWGFRKLNVSDPALPQTESMLEEGWDMQHLCADGHLLYLSTWERLWIYDYHDPENPQLLGSDTTWTKLTRICIQENVVFGIQKQTLFIIDVADPGNMSEIGRYGIEEGTLRAVQVKGAYVYLVVVSLPDQASRLDIIDISNLSAPTKAGEFILAGEGRDLFLQEDSSLAFVAYHVDSLNNALQIIDVSAPDTPVLLGETPTTGRPSCIWVADTLVWIGSNTSNNNTWYLETFNMAGDKTRPVKINETSGSGWICDIEVRDDKLIASLPSNSIQIYNAASLMFLARCASPKSLFLTTMYFPFQWMYYIFTINGFISPDMLTASASWGTFVSKLKATRKVAKIKVSPSDTTISKGQKVKFVAVGLDCTGAPIATNVKWSTDGGSIDQTGTYTATSEGNFTVTAEDTLSKVSGSAIVLVTSTGIKRIKKTVTDFHLSQNYPNPFNPTTSITFSVKENCHVRLKVFDIQGREVTTLLDGFHEAGDYKCRFDARRLASGVYFYEIRMKDFYEIKKMILLE